MKMLSNKELIDRAKSVINPRKIENDCLVGDVGCALVTDKGNVYLGICIDACCGIGFCAEHTAVATMVTHGEYIVKKIVAVSEYGITSPCGRCRELIHQINKENDNAEVIISEKKKVKLKDLLPYPWDK